MTNDTRPPVAPKEGHYAMLRNGEVVGPIKLYDQSRYHPYSFTAHLPHMNWTAKGVSSWDDPQYDIIATISPEAMALAIHPDMDGAVKAIENLVKLADAVLDYADANCRAFPIATAPNDRAVEFWNKARGKWELFEWRDLNALSERYTHWREPSPPPTTPPLPAVFVELGVALERLKAPHA
jgi:hypothetical protein